MLTRDTSAHQDSTGTAPSGTSAFTRYSFYFEAFVHTPIIVCVNTPFVWAPHPPPLSPTRLRNILFPPDPVRCNVCHTILVMSISCKGQAAHRRRHSRSQHRRHGEYSLSAVRARGRLPLVGGGVAVGGGGGGGGASLPHSAMQQTPSARVLHVEYVERGIHI